MENDHQFTGRRFGFAFISVIIINVFAAIFILPWSIWVGATVRLGRLFEEGGILMNLRKSEAIATNWLRLSMDGFIFMAYIAGIIVAMVALGKTGFRSFMLVLILSYFAPLAISIIKEFLLILPVGKYLKLEEIADSLRNNKSNS